MIYRDPKNYLAIVKENGSALEFGSPTLKSDREVVLDAINKNGLALEFASPELQNKSNIILDTVKKLPYSSICITSMSR